MSQSIKKTLYVRSSVTYETQIPENASLLFHTSKIHIFLEILPPPPAPRLQYCSDVDSSFELPTCAQFRPSLCSSPVRPQPPSTLELDSVFLEGNFTLVNKRIQLSYVLDKGSEEFEGKLIFCHNTDSITDIVLLCIKLSILFVIQLSQSIVFLHS